VLDAKLELLALVEERERRRRYNAASTIFPDDGPLRRELYPKHMRFFAAGKSVRVRAFLAANRIGKTTAGTLELSYHLTGQYPEWWVGKRFHRPIRAWAVSDTQSSVRDNVQRKLIGTTASVGTGWVPRDAIINTASKSQPSGAIDFAQVRHASGGMSVVTFKSYDMGRAKFQGDDIDVILLDEEPGDYGIYSECVTRTATTQGIVMLTFTSLRGITPLICRFMPEFAAGTDLELEDDGSSREIVVCGWDDVPHLDDETKRELKAEYAPHELQARTQGIPNIGVGQIYPVPESEFVIDPIRLPDYWPRVCALDPGWNRTAAIWAAHDVETDTVYLYSEHYRGYAEVEVHAAAIKARGIRIPVVSDDATDVEGASVVGKYAKQGLLIRKTQKSDKDARIQEVYSRLSTGRMKVFSTLHNWLFEFRMYRRDEQGRIASEHDHAMNCTEYIVQSGLKVARPLNPPREIVTVQEQTFGIYD
jgi:phage terminase large subunit-like protein